MLMSTGTISYLLVGLITAGITMYIFPPMEGFRPKLSIVMTAIVVFTLLWPAIVLMALWYFVRTYAQAHNERTANTYLKEETLRENPVLKPFAASKPR
ncbi:MAG: hypothetical protein O7C67_05855 [Gammaproteobacteria bacterium]|nr:hypothetical protein [Gammaproteobacteria bacterium]